MIIRCTSIKKDRYVNTSDVIRWLKSNMKFIRAEARKSVLRKDLDDLYRIEGYLDSNATLLKVMKKLLKKGDGK